MPSARLIGDLVRVDAGQRAEIVLSSRDLDQPSSESADGVVTVQLSRAEFGMGQIVPSKPWVRQCGGSRLSIPPTSASCIASATFGSGVGAIVAAAGFWR